jgi:hypothetical protein
MVTISSIDDFSSRDNIQACAERHDMGVEYYGLEKVVVGYAFSQSGLHRRAPLIEAPNQDILTLDVLTSMEGCLGAGSEVVPLCRSCSTDATCGIRCLAIYWIIPREHLTSGVCFQKAFAGAAHQMIAERAPAGIATRILLDVRWRRGFQAPCLT